MEPQTLQVVYFAEPGPQNTEATLAAAERRARELGIRHVVVASDTGKTAQQALATLGPAFRVIVVTNPAGLKLPITKLHDYLPRFQEHKQRLVEQGLTEVPCSLSDEVVTELTEAGAVVERIDWRKLAAYTRDSLRAIDWIGVGIRVGLTITVWAALAEAVPLDQEVVAIAGTGFGGGGADSAVVIRTAAQWRDWRVLETIVRPRESPPTER